MRLRIAEDGREFARTLAKMVRGDGREVVEAVPCALDANRVYRRHKAQVVLMDFKLGAAQRPHRLSSVKTRGVGFFFSGLSEYRDFAVLQKRIATPCASGS